MDRGQEKLFLKTRKHLPLALVAGEREDRRKDSDRVKSNGNLYNYYDSEEKGTSTQDRKSRSGYREVCRKRTLQKKRYLKSATTAGKASFQVIFFPSL